MAEHPIVNIRTLQDLKKVLTVQKMITDQAKRELLAAASDAQLLDASFKENRVVEFMAEEKKILEKYANNPTLTEFNLIPNLKGGTHFGATFGVTLLVGELILEQVKAMQGQFEPVLRRMFLTLLMELDRPRHRYLTEPLEKAMKFKCTKPDGTPVPPEQQGAFKKRMLFNVTESFLIVGKQYGLVAPGNGGWHITDLGKRVLLHLLDADKFVNLVVQAHEKFSKNPALDVYNKHKMPS